MFVQLLAVDNPPARLDCAGETRRMRGFQYLGRFSLLALVCAAVVAVALWTGNALADHFPSRGYAAVKAGPPHHLAYAVWTERYADVAHGGRRFGQSSMRSKSTTRWSR